MYFCQKNENWKKTYLKCLVERLTRDGFSKSEIVEMCTIIECEKIVNIPTLEAIVNNGPLG